MELNTLDFGLSKKENNHFSGITKAFSSLVNSVLDKFKSEQKPWKNSTEDLEISQLNFPFKDIEPNTELTETENFRANTVFISLFIYLLSYLKDSFQE